MGTNGFNECCNVYSITEEGILHTACIDTCLSSAEVGCNKNFMNKDAIKGTTSDTENKNEPEVDPEVKSTLTAVCEFQNGVGIYKKLYATFYKDGFKTSKKALIPDIKNVIVHNNHVVIVEFVDGTSEKAVLHPEDQFSVEQGISICITKKLVGGSSIYNKLIDRAVKVMINSDAERTKKQIEDEARKERKKKNDEKKARRKAAKREEYIETQKEAYIRALREVGIGG